MNSKVTYEKVYNYVTNQLENNKDNDLAEKFFKRLNKGEEKVSLQKEFRQKYRCPKCKYATLSIALGDKKQYITTSNRNEDKGHIFDEKTGEGCPYYIQEISNEERVTDYAKKHPKKIKNSLNKLMSKLEEPNLEPEKKDDSSEKDNQILINEKQENPKNKTKNRVGIYQQKLNNGLFNLAKATFENDNEDKIGPKFFYGEVKIKYEKQVGKSKRYKLIMIDNKKERFMGTFSTYSKLQVNDELKNVNNEIFSIALFGNVDINKSNNRIFLNIHIKTDDYIKLKKHF